MKLDMTKGNILPLIITFAVPLFFSNLFQQFYNIADTAIVGHTLGDHALSAVGAVSSIYGLVTSLCFGMSNGFSILISKYYGARDDKRLKQAVAGNYLLSMLFTVVLTVLGFAVLRPFLRVLNTPAEIMDDAYTYISIIIVGLAAMVLYNMQASILRALGNSKTPLIFLIISSLLNIGLDFFMILVLKMGIAGAALATVVSQLVSGVMCVIYSQKKQLIPKLSRENFHLPAAMVKELLASGSAMSLMFAVVSLGTVILQSGINGLGTTTIAAHTAARKISEMYMMVGSTLAATMSTFASQNYGAKKMDRVWEGVKKTHYLGFAWATIALVFTYVFASTIIRLLTGSDNGEVIATGARYLKINLPFYYPLMVLVILRNTLQGIGDRIMPLVASMVELLGKIVAVKFFIAPLGYTAVCFCEPVTWILCCFPVVTAFFGKKEIRSTLHIGSAYTENKERIWRRIHARV